MNMLVHAHRKFNTQLTSNKFSVWNLTHKSDTKARIDVTLKSADRFNIDFHYSNLIARR